ncbi:MAG: hypothetical protein IPI06_09900 [Gammaproteobacteria bacterium]|nr:hypothetical protein [Gammaproteobacteria bacterium]
MWTVGRLWLCIAVAVAVLLPGGVRAASIETLLMPGKVISGHADIETQCSRCHDRADRARQSSLCRGCHEKVDADILGRRGLHGRVTRSGQVKCTACHSEHQGRDADIVKFAPDRFDHAATDFALDSRHQAVACTACHASGKAYREAPGNCFACHRKDDAHAGSLGQDCGSCHAGARWSDFRFDHGRTHFALTGAHREVGCGACHSGHRYGSTPVRCASCHAPDDVHGGTRGAGCANCHTTVAWDDSKFDHAEETGFALLGGHRDLECTGCHRSGRMEDDLPKDCHGCHAGDDPHEGRFERRCDRCHTENAWKPARFDHLKETRFALAGAHGRIDCHACHAAPLGNPKLSDDCASCHRASDVHAGKLGRDCQQCHGVEAWRTALVFDHDLADFPLVGLHVAVPCVECHRKPEFKGVPRDCVGCHQRADVHKGGLGRACGTCHSPNGWAIWDFDHGKETGFALTGAHARSACADCHRRPASEVKLARDCAACHVREDKHLGQFGRQCQRCHGTTSFRGARLQ